MSGIGEAPGLPCLLVIDYSIPKIDKISSLKSAENKNVTFDSIFFGENWNKVWRKFRIFLTNFGKIPLFKNYII